MILLQLSLTEHDLTNEESRRSHGPSGHHQLTEEDNPIFFGRGVAKYIALNKGALFIRPTSCRRNAMRSRAGRYQRLSMRSSAGISLLARARSFVPSPNSQQISQSIVFGQ